MRTLSLLHRWIGAIGGLLGAFLTGVIALVVAGIGLLWLEISLH